MKVVVNARSMVLGMLALAVLLFGGCVQAESPLLSADSSVGEKSWKFQAHYDQPTVTLYLFDNGQKNTIGTRDLTGVNSTTTISGAYKNKPVQASCKTDNMGLFEFTGSCIVYVDGKKATTLFLN